MAEFAAGFPKQATELVGMIYSLGGKHCLRRLVLGKESPPNCTYKREVGLLKLRLEFYLTYLFDWLFQIGCEWNYFYYLFYIYYLFIFSILSAGMHILIPSVQILTL